MSRARSAPARSASSAGGGAPRVLEGTLEGAGLRIAVLLSRFNERVGARLLEGALGALERRGVRARDVLVVKVPGAFELPAVAKRLAASRKHDAIVCLGAVVRGETPHFDYVAGEASRGIARTSYESGVPVLFGVLTTDTEEQALERAGGAHGNKGEEAAEGAIEMARLCRALGRRPR
ncbi:MAG TPA: 6,7-dimethyl-8-ribityllumazine synthase [Candidatus Dormibacteraeota bacterium]|nr:6,7-dimethyl-8-ribityllumazine synthase [Candidatus Dormibacteraeota bacterium]